MIEVSIIIINYNTLDLTIECINSIYNNTDGITFEIIVVDNQSRICPLDTIKNIFKEVIVVKSSVNLGFGKANNLGSENAKGKYLFFLNSDTILINNAIYILYKFIENNQDKRIAAVGANLYTKYNEANYSYSMYFPSIWRIFLYRLRISKIVKEDFFNDSIIAKKVKIIIGADLLIRSEIFHKIGKFDPYYFMYIEDGDLQYQLDKNKFNVYNVPQAKIIHLQGASSTTGEKMIMEFKSYHYYFKKSTNKWYTYLYVLIEFLFAFFYYIIFIILRNKIKKYNYLTLLKVIYNEYLFAKNIK